MTADLAPPSSPVSPLTAGVALRSNALGAAGIAFLVISAAGPLGYLGGFTPLMIGVGGAGAPAAFVGSGLVLLLFLAGFTAMTPAVRSQGAFYAYISTGLGRAAGAASAVVALVAYNIALIGALGLISVYVAQDVQMLTGMDVPWPVAAVAVGLLIFLLAAAGIGVGAKVLAVLLTAELALVALLAGAVIVRGGAEGLSLASFAPSAVFAPGMGAVLALAFVGFLGIEAIALYRAEARDPDRTIPRAGVATVVIIAVFYALVTWVVIQGFGTEGIAAAVSEHGADLFFVLADVYLGPWASTLMQILILTSLLAAQLAFHNGANRYAHSLSLDRVLHRSIAATSSRTGAPWMAGLLQTAVSVIAIVVAALLGLDPYLDVALWLTSMAAVFMIVLQVVTSIAVVVHFRRTTSARMRRIVAPTLAAVLLVAVLAVLVTQFDLLTGAGPGVNAVLLAILGGVIGLSAAWAALTWIRRPAKLALVGVRPADDPLAATVPTSTSKEENHR
ncbi:MAG: APC family permease [Microbacterium sp.]|uniref:APC family permease n=1 Tax=Microbacterium sp. TaxID=51671 RepID=UPI001AD2D5BB|nr:APC family permease [Microbacterium sp.]MBN9176065.1 APC family permease [Microbacterium sp.]